MGSSGSLVAGVVLASVDPTPSASTSGRVQFSAFGLFHAQCSPLWVCAHVPDVGHKVCI